MFNLRERKKTTEVENEVFDSWLSHQYMFCPTHPPLFHHYNKHEVSYYTDILTLYYSVSFR